MRRYILAAALLLVGVAMAGAEAPADKQAELEKLLRQLEKDITAVRGLAFKEPVKARILPRPKDAPAGVQGYYSTKDKALVVYDDVRSSYQKGVLVHEMVHALQDQHFGLKKLHEMSFGSDAEMARAALIEGDATFTMIKVLEKEQPHVLRMLDTRLETAKNLQNAFLYGVGAQYVQRLHQRGGWASVNFRYRFPPQSTAEVLGAGGSPVSLGPGPTRGAYALIEMFAAHPATKAEAVHLAKVYRGDRARNEGDNKGWVVALSSPEEARRFGDALARLRAAEFPKRKQVAATDTVRVWEDGKGGRHAVIARGPRVLELSAPSARAFAAWRDRVEGPPELTIWSAKEKRAITFGALIDRLLEADVVCVGETHDSDLHHQVQLAVLRGLHARDDRLGVGLEMFQKPYQKVLDRYVAGNVSEAVMLEDTEYRTRWGFDWSLYEPIVSFCARNRVPLAALNAARELTQKVSKNGHDKLSDEDRKALGPIDFHFKPHRDYWFERLSKMHGGGGKSSPEAKERGYQVMTIWDDHMARTAVEFQSARGLRRMVVLAGSGHIDRGIGIPMRAARYGGGKVLSVSVVLTEKDYEGRKADPPAEFVVLAR